jgi:hypothetical protein
MGSLGSDDTNSPGSRFYGSVIFPSLRRNGHQAKHPYMIIRFIDLASRGRILLEGAGEILDMQRGGNSSRDGRRAETVRRMGSKLQNPEKENSG